MIRVNTAMLVVRHRAMVNELFRDGKGILRVYNGDMPPNPTTTPTGVLIATCYTVATTAPTVTTTTTPIAFDDGIVGNDGTPTFARLFVGDGTPVCDISIGDEASSEPLKYSSPDFFLGGLVKITSFNLTEA